MPIQFPNFGNIPYVKPDYSGIVDFIPNALNAYTATNEAIENPFKLRHERMMNEQKLQEQMMKNALEKEFGRSGKQSDIAYKMASAKHLLDMRTPAMKELESAYGINTPEFKEAMQDYYKASSGKTSLTQGQRALNAMPAAAKEHMYAQTRAWGFTDPEVNIALAEGKTLEDLKESARLSGVDVDNAPLQYAQTGSTISQAQKRKVLAAGSSVLDEAYSKANEKYVAKFGGYSPVQILDHLKNDKQAKEDLTDFYAARMLEEENATLAVAKTGGRMSLHAVQNMIDKGAGNTKVIPAQMTPEIYRESKRKARVILDRMMEAEQNALDYRKNNERNTSSKSPEAYKEEKGLQDMVKVKDHKTGKIEIMTREKAQRLQEEHNG